MEQRPESQPLSDLRVIDLTNGIAGPYCTKLLADFGADVIKVERPSSGDYARRLGPFPGDISHPEKSGIFLFLNTNKRGITLDLKTTGGVEALKELVRGADILVESFKPGVMARLGLGYEELKEVSPELIMTSVSNFGQTGPYRDYLTSELAMYSMGGRMADSGLPDRYPVKAGGNHQQYQAGNSAAMATLFAWYGREYQGLGGQQVDVSFFETQLASYNGKLPRLVQYAYNGERSRRRDAGSRGYPSGHYLCKDGNDVQVTGGGARSWPRTVKMLGMPELEHDPRFAPPEGQLSREGKEEFERTMWLPWLMERTANQVMEECQKHEIFAVAVSTIDQVVDNNPQLAFRKYFLGIDHPVGGLLRYPGAPIFNNNGWWSIRRPAPLLGQHDREILQNGRASWEEETESPAGDAAFARPSRRSRDIGPSAQRKEEGKLKLPLEGIRIIDLTLVAVGPYGTMFLADMGAEVIRVEPIHFLPTGGRGQLARPTKEAEAESPTSSYPDRDPGERPWNRVSNRNAILRNKYSMTSNIATPEGKEVFHRLVEVSDILIENNVPGSMERLGLTYSVVSQWNPRLIMISSTGVGQAGPWSVFRGTGGFFESFYGHSSAMGYPDMGPEGSPGGVASDAAAGVTIVTAAIMALHQRKKTGRGMFVDISMGENFIAHLGELFMDFIINGRVAGPPGNRDHMGHIVQGVYQCAGDDEWIAISISKIQQWHALCRLMGKTGLAENQPIEDMAALRAQHDEVDQVIGAWTVDKDPIHLFHKLQGQGIAAGPVLHEEHAFRDPHIKERGFLVEVTQADAGSHLYPSTIFKMSQVPFEVRKPPVRLGEDNDYIYRDVLKLSEKEYDRLKDLGHIGMDYAPHVK